MRYLILVVIFLCANCSACQGKEALSMVDEFDKAKSWVAGFNKQQNELFLKICSNICRQDKKEVRQFIKKFLKKKGNEINLADLGKIYILNRLYFDLPSKERLDKARFFGGWIGVPVFNEKEVNILWPLSKNKDGSIFIEYPFEGYLGEAYQALEEFDWMERNYKKRKTP